MEEKFEILNVDETKYQTKLTRKYQLKKQYVPKNPKLVIAFIPGAIREIFVKVGQQVFAGDKLLILEAMKMKNILLAPVDGKVKSINVAIGQNVPKSYLMLELE